MSFSAWARGLSLGLAAALLCSCTTAAEEATTDPTLGSAELSTTSEPGAEDAGSETESDTDGDSNADGEAGSSSFLPEGMTAGDLPPDVEERARMVTQWVDANMSESSGFSLSLDPPVDFQFSVDIADVDEAATRCQTFEQVVAAYLTESETGTIAVEGWVLGDDGSFSGTSWESFVCT